MTPTLTSLLSRVRAASGPDRERLMNAIADAVLAAAPYAYMGPRNPSSGFLEIDGEIDLEQLVALLSALEQKESTG